MMCFFLEDIYTTMLLNRLPAISGFNIGAKQVSIYSNRKLTYNTTSAITNSSFTKPWLVLRLVFKG